jgi:hypothetical protein
MLRYNKKLQDHIIELLAREPYLRTRTLHEKLNRAGQRFSLRALYKELEHLIDEGIVVRWGKELGLSLPWLNQLAAFVDEAHDRYTGEGVLRKLLPIPNQPLVLTFSELNTLDAFCSQLISTLHHEHPRKAMFVWHPRQWFHIVRDEAESRLKHSLAVTRYQRYIIVGGQSYLDKFFLRNLPKSYVVSTAPGPFHTSRNTYYGVIADTVLTVKLAKQSAERIDELYDRVRTRQDFSESELLTLLRSKIPSRVKVEVAPKRAAELKKHFCDYFGLSSKSEDV